MCLHPQYSFTPRCRSQSVCDVPHSYVTWPQHSFTCCTHVYVTCLLHMSRDIIRLWHDSFMCVTWRIHKCDMTSYVCALNIHSLVTHCTHVYVTCFIHMSHDSFVSATWFIHICSLNHSHVYNDAFMCGTTCTNTKSNTHTHTHTHTYTHTHTLSPTHTHTNTHALSLPHTPTVSD